MTVYPSAVGLGSESVGGREDFPPLAARSEISDRSTPIVDGQRSGLEWTWAKDYHHLLGRIIAPCRLRVWDDGLVEGHMEDCRNLLNPLSLEFAFAVEVVITGAERPTTDLEWVAGVRSDVRHGWKRGSPNRRHDHALRGL